MGLFGRKNKNKKKNRVSFGDEVCGDNEFQNSVEDEKLQMSPPITNNNSLTSSSSSSRVQQIERAEESKQRKITSTDDIMLPFREPTTMSVSSDIVESNHQKSHKNVVGKEENVRNVVHEESEFIYESDDIDDDEEIVFLDDVTSATNEEEFYYVPPKDQKKTNEDTENNNNKTTMPSIPDLDAEDISKRGSVTNHDLTAIGTNMSALAIERKNSNSNSTQKTQGKTRPISETHSTSTKNNHNTSQSYPGSASSESNASATEQHVHRQQQQQYQQLSQQQQYPQQTQHEIQSEKTRDLVKIFIGEIWNRGEIESIEKVCSPRLRFNGHTGLERVGHDGFSRMVATVRSSLEGYHCEIHSMVVEGRKCFCRLKFTGKHVGELMGYPPTRKLVAWMGASEFTICPRRNQILKVWELGDIKTLEAQLMG